MPDDAARLARLEQALAEERRARLAVEARLDAAIKQIEHTAAEAQAGLVAAIVAEQHERERASVQQEADRKWLAALSEHINIAQREAHDGLAGLQASQQADHAWLTALAEHVNIVQRQATGWVESEGAARTEADAALAAIRQAHAGLVARLDERPYWETSIRAEVMALTHLVDDLAAAVFPAGSADPPPAVLDPLSPR